MRIFNLLCCLVICLCVRFSHQDDYTESDDYVVDPDSADTAAVNETTSSTVENSTAANDIECKYIDRAITIAENSTAFLTCTPNDPNYTEATWLVRDASRLMINKILINESSASVLTILDVTRNDSGSYWCRKAPNLTERVHLNVHVPNVTISDRSHIFIRNGGTINLTCTTVSVDSPDVITWYYNDTQIQNSDQQQWQSKHRICMSDGADNCLIKTTFKLVVKDVDAQKSGTYSCGTDSIPAAKVFVQVLGERKRIDGTFHPYTQNQMYEYATEALESYGIQKATAEYVRKKCTEAFAGYGNCNCILAADQFVFSLAKSKGMTFVEFKIGQISFAVYHLE